MEVLLSMDAAVRTSAAEMWLEQLGMYPAGHWGKTIHSTGRESACPDTLKRVPG